MGNRHSSTPDAAGETKLRGKGLEGSEQPEAADHLEYSRKRNPDTVIRDPNDPDSLYNDGLEVGDDSETLFGTQNVNRGN